MKAFKADRPFELSHTRPISAPCSVVGLGTLVIALTLALYLIFW